MEGGVEGVAIEGVDLGVEVVEGAETEDGEVEEEVEEEEEEEE